MLHTRRIAVLAFCLAALRLTLPIDVEGLRSTELMPVVTGQETASGEVSPEADEVPPLPLEAARRLRFATDEGSWMTLDVSPDGETIVFDLLGDLYTLPIEGGAAERITEGMAFDSEPRFSPDGRTVVFTSDRNGAENVWVLDLETGEARAVTTEKSHRYQSPEWTPDGDYIVVARSGFWTGASKLWLFHKDGGSGLQLVEEPEELKTVDPAFGPDPRYIWFSERTGRWQYNAILPQYQLGVYDRDTGERYTRSSRFGSAFRPTLSPDGRWLVYGTRQDAETGLRLRDLEDGEERWLAYPVQRDDQESIATRGVLPGMAFTPDSRELIVSYGGKLWALPVDAGGSRQIPFRADVDIGIGPRVDFDYPIDDASTLVIRQIRDTVPSPDGTRLALVAMDRIYVMDYPDGTPRRLTGSDVVEAQPAWSPDGTSIVYATWASDGGHLYASRAAGESDPVQLTRRPALYRQPAWSPDGERIVFVRDAARQYREDSGGGIPSATAEIAWIPADGGPATVVAPAGGRIRPHFAADPERVFLYSSEDGLTSIRWDGTDERGHIKVTGLKPPDAEEPPDASLILMSPVGGEAVAAVGNQLYRVAVPWVGGDTRTVSVADPDSASVPVARLTEIGAQFPAWSSDGRRVHWSIGNAHLVFDLDEAAASRLEDESDVEEGDEGAARERGYEPSETRVRIEAARDIPEGVLLVSGARVITMRGEEVIEAGDVLIRNNRIEAVGPVGSFDLPADAEVMDVSGLTILPGFVDVHAHLGVAYEIHKTESWQYLANLAYGVTTTRDPQTGTTDVLSYADHVETGDMLGPRIYSTGPGVFWEEQVQDLEHARRVLDRYSDYYNTQTIKMYVAGNRQQRQWILMAAAERGLMPTTEGALDLKLNLTQFIDGYPGHEHSLPVFPLYGDIARLMAAAGTVYTPTLLVAYGGPWAENYFYTRENPHDDGKLRRFTPHEEVDRRTRRRGEGVSQGPGGWFMEEEHVFGRHARFLQEVVAAGGRAGVGSHGQLQGLGYHWELWAMQSGGLSEHDALRLATIGGADAIGLAGDLGSIEEGKLADLVILDENPLDDIRNTNTIRQVMKNGRLYDADTLDEVYPRRRPAGAFPWQEEPEPVALPGVAR